MICLLVFAKRNIRLFVCFHTLLEVFKRFHRILVLIIWTGEFQAHICLQQLVTKSVGIEVIKEVSYVFILAYALNEENS